LNVLETLVTSVGRRNDGSSVALEGEVLAYNTNHRWGSDQDSLRGVDPHAVVASVASQVAVVVDLTDRAVLRTRSTVGEQRDGDIRAIIRARGRRNSLVEARNVAGWESWRAGGWRSVKYIDNLLRGVRQSTSRNGKPSTGKLVASASEWVRVRLKDGARLSKFNIQTWARRVGAHSRGHRNVEARSVDDRWVGRSDGRRSGVGDLNHLNVRNTTTEAVAESPSSEDGVIIGTAAVDARGDESDAAVAAHGRAKRSSRRQSLRARDGEVLGHDASECGWERVADGDGLRGRSSLTTGIDSGPSVDDGILATGRRSQSLVERNRQGALASRQSSDIVAWDGVIAAEVQVARHTTQCWGLVVDDELIEILRGQVTAQIHC
jgi:hypothetical protein